MMLRMLLELMLLLAVGYINDVAAQPYQVNSQAHPACTNGIFSLRQDSNLATGATSDPSESWPCSGYLLYTVNSGTQDIRRMCTMGGPTDSAFHKEAAERYCYMLGVNYHRPITGSSVNTKEQVKLYNCDAKTSGVDVPDPVGSENVVGVFDGNPGASAGKRCDAQLSSPDSACYDECYRGTTNNGPTHEDAAGLPEAACLFVGAGFDIPYHPFWALTCSDINECAVGVQFNCSDPFNCLSRVACGPKANCANLVGSFLCSCPPGYEPANGDTSDPYNLNAGCTDINECDNPDICGPMSRCINKEGTYICICNNPLKYDAVNNICEEPICPQIPLILNARPTATIPATPQVGDSVIYICENGFVVRPETTPSPVLALYGYGPETAFAVTCTEDETWQPEPEKMCQRVSCGDPGIVCYANRTGSSFLYEDEVTFVCKEGFQLKEGGNNFQRTCQNDGTWTKTYECVDIDECNLGSVICDGVTRHCINTIGSYFCSCVPWSERDGLEEQCMEWGGLIDFPRYEACEMVERLGFCNHGRCEMEDDKAYCRCDEGYEGDSCDRWKQPPSFVMALVALILVAVLIMLLVFCCLCQWIRRGRQLTAPLPYPTMVAPAYGGFPGRPIKPYGGRVY